MLIFLLLITGTSWAGKYDMNPGREAIKYKHEMTDDVTGQGFAVEYKSVNTNNLSLLEYYHGSGNVDMADILNSEQKTTCGTYYYMDEFGMVKKAEKGAQ